MLTPVEANPPNLIPTNNNKLYGILASACMHAIHNATHTCCISYNNGMSGLDLYCEYYSNQACMLYNEFIGRIMCLPLSFPTVIKTDYHQNDHS